MIDQNESYLIVGLGNPGKDYEKTLHNFGFIAVSSYANKHNMSFSKNKKVDGMLCHGNIDGKKVILLLPLTYMNDSGRSIRLAIEFFKINTSNILVVVDDVAIPFGDIRIRKQGSDGGHNGLKSITKYLHTQEYARMKLGVGEKPQYSDLSDFVLGNFSVEQKKGLPDIITKAVDGIDLWLNEGAATAMNKMNVTKKIIDEESQE
jgi:peptidyl-tRNA hydrolase, PTH1 family